MATNNQMGHGVLPDINSIVAGLAIIGVYLVRIGVVAEGQTPWVVLAFTTDFLLPLLAGVWLLVVPTLTVLRKVF